MYTYRRYALYLDHHNVEAELAFAAAGARAASFERVTMLREPLSRFFSLYAYLWSDPIFGKTSGASCGEALAGYDNWTRSTHLGLLARGGGRDGGGQ